jgi:3'-phosphoadenosine 5'-phosphosulfate sulfotransferase (PAPS reductase)/FAD synthetase
LVRAVMPVREIAGVSGGRTSAEMACRLRGRGIVFSFQNTSREAVKTYEFIERLEQYLEEPIVRLEFRAPPRGEPPINATFEVVEHRHLQRRGEVFRDMLEMVRTFRATGAGRGGTGPIAPWARSRICTAYMKARTQRKYCASLGWGGPTEYTEYIGLRADEPARVAKMRGRNADRDTDERAPLAEWGVTKEDVLAAWRARPFDLEVEEHMGNCTGCFLKDEADLATALLQPETDAEGWIAIEENYAPMRRGRPSYRQVLAEAPERMKIRAALASGGPLALGQANLANLPPRRLKLVIAQEVERRDNGPKRIACECDAAKGEDFDDNLEAA